MRTLAILLLWILPALSADAPPVKPPTVKATTKFPNFVSPDQRVSIESNLAKDSPVTVNLLPIGGEKIVRTSELKADEKGALIFELPEKLPAGDYYFTVVATAGASQETVPGVIHVKGDAVKLEYAYPATAYPSESGHGFDFAVIGQNFSLDPTENHVIIDGQGEINSQKTETCKDQKEVKKLPCLWVESPQKLHVVGYRPERYHGTLSLRVRVAGSDPTESKPLVLARIPEIGVLLWALGTFTLVVLAIYFLVGRTIEATTPDGRRLPKYAAFLLDKETDSYSLSKFQLFLFTGVFVFGYIYLFLCRWLVQWNFDLPDVPGEVAGLLAISGGTAVAAVGATAARGSKGSGQMGPTVADFVSSGGLVVAERFQFFVWTIIACAGFLALIISKDPSTVTGFPTFPQGLLYVMGISAAGYLGGKVTRKAGPVLRNIAVEQPDNDGTVITLQGDNLSPAGDYFIDGHKLPLIVDDQGKPKQLSQITPQADNPAFASQITITIDPEAAIDLKSDEHTFRMLNPDGQFSEIRFTIRPPQIADVTDENGKGLTIKAGNQEIAITVRGKNFKQGSTARWKAPGSDKPVDIPAAQLVFVDADTLKIRLVPGKPGPGTLLVVLPGGFTVIKEVTVEASAT